MQPDSRIYVAGHRGLVGSALMRGLRSRNCRALITRTHAELDLTDQRAVQEFFALEKPEYVFLAAAKVGGILANASFPAEFVHQNLAIQANVIHESWRAGVKRLLFLGSSCIYPRDCPQPIKEEYLLTGPLEPTNRPYALAKIAGIEMCWSYNRQYGTRFLAAMPTNLYGPGDNYDLLTSHAIPALIRKFYLARLAMQGEFDDILRDQALHGRIPPDIRKSLDAGGGQVILWGSGRPRREFLYCDDMANACIFLMSLPAERYDALLGAGETTSGPVEPPLINIGCGTDLSLDDLARMVKRVAGYSGSVAWDSSKPDGTPRKLLDVSKQRFLGWGPSIGLESGLVETMASYLSCRIASPAN